MFWRQMLSLARGGLVTSKPRINEPRRELGQRPRPKKGRYKGIQWLKWSSLRGTGASAQASTGRECTGSRGQISNFVRRECELLAPPHQQLAGEQQPDIEMQFCSFGQIRRKQNAMSHEILA